jgi:hypothetical protein
MDETWIHIYDPETKEWRKSIPAFKEAQDTKAFK